MWLQLCNIQTIVVSTNGLALTIIQTQCEINVLVKLNLKNRLITLNRVGIKMEMRRMLPVVMSPVIQTVSENGAASISPRFYFWI